MKIAVCILFLFASSVCRAQTKTATVLGTVIDDNGVPLAGATVTVLGKQSGLTTSDSGRFQLEVPARKAFALVFTHTGFRDEQKDFYLTPGEKEAVTVQLLRSSKTLQTVVIHNEKERKEAGLIRIDAKNALIAPGAAGGVENLIKTLVGSNNELTSQYSVRGGNYDENLIYINDFEIYRPYLVSNGQQEGLSFINPQLVKNIRFYTGGFPAKYGDKISSALDIQYRDPVSFGGSVYLSPLEQGLHLEGISKNHRWSFLLGARSKTNRNLLASQETKGNYIPSASDLQTFITFNLADRWQLQFLGIISRSQFSFVPESAQKSTAVFSPLFTANLGLDIYFDGQEKDSYNSNLAGLSLIQSVNKDVTLKWLLSRYGDKENENRDVTGAYLFGERNFDRSQADFGQITNPLGAGVYQDYGRNNLGIAVYTLAHKGTWYAGRHFLQWGLSAARSVISDHLDQWEMQDSAGYSLPYNPGRLDLSSVLKSNEHLNSNKYSAYGQDNIRLSRGASETTLDAGFRLNYDALNKEFLVSPRVQISYKPDWKRDVIFKAATGIYDQPPFYLEMRRPDGSLNTALKSQKSIQYVAGADYRLPGVARPTRITAEAYYKWLWDVDPYDIDNLQIRYFGQNNARAYAAGIETRIYTELVKDAESWFSLAIARTRENLSNDYYYTYKNKEGETIGAATKDQVVADSIKTDIGWIRRPTDRLITMGLFLQDYLSTNKNFKVHLNLIYGSNMSYTIPGNMKYRDALVLEPYIRADIGFSALLLSDKTRRRSHSPFRSFKNIWASLEVFNLIDRANTISYQLVKDFANDVFSIPNRLTPRLVNFKILATF